MFQFVWRIVNMTLTALVLIAFVHRIGWIDWNEQIARIADYYSAIRNDVLEFISIPLPIDLPWWSGDAFLLWWSFGQATLLSSYFKNRDFYNEPPISVWEIFRMGIAGPITVTYVYFQGYISGMREKGGSFWREKLPSKIGKAYRFAAALLRYYLVNIVPMVLLLTAFFWLALAINFYLSLPTQHS